MVASTAVERKLLASLLHDAYHDRRNDITNLITSICEATEKMEQELEDIRKRLQGLPESSLSGELGLAAATMRLAEVALTDRTKAIYEGAIQRLVGQGNILKRLPDESTIQYECRVAAAVLEEADRLST